MDPPFRTECTVSGSLSFILRLSRVAGIAPLKFKRVRNGSSIRVSRVYSLYGKVLAILCASFTAVALIVDLTVDTETSLRTNTNAGRVVWILILVIVNAVVITAAFTGMNRMRCLVDSLAKLKQINKELNLYSGPTLSSERKKWLLIIFSLILGSITVSLDAGLLVYEVASVNGKVLTTSFYLFFGITYIQMEIFVLQFAMILMWVIPTLQCLNTCLKNILQDICETSSVASAYIKPAWINEDTDTNAFNRKAYNSVIHVKQSKLLNRGIKTSTSLHRLAFLFCSLCNVIRQLDECHGFLLVMLLLCFLLQSIITPYHLMDELMHTEQTFYFTFALHTARAVFHFSMLLKVIEPCHRTHDEIDLTRSLITKMLRYIPPDNLAVISELKLFYRHFFLNQVTYSPMQLFTLNRSLIAVIVGSITTYLVVIVQL